MILLFWIPTGADYTYKTGSHLIPSILLAIVTCIHLSLYFSPGWLQPRVQPAIFLSPYIPSHVYIAVKSVWTQDLVIFNQYCLRICEPPSWAREAVVIFGRPSLKIRMFRSQTPVQGMELGASWFGFSICTAFEDGTMWCEGVLTGHFLVFDVELF